MIGNANTLFTELAIMAEELWKFDADRIRIEQEKLISLRDSYYHLLGSIEASIPKEDENLSQDNIAALKAATQHAMQFLMIVDALPEDLAKNLKQKEQFLKIKEYTRKSSEIYANLELNQQRASKPQPTTDKKIFTPRFHEKKKIKTIVKEIEKKKKSLAQKKSELEKKSTEHESKADIYVVLTSVSAILVITLPLAAIFGYKLYQTSKETQSNQKALDQNRKERMSIAKLHDDVATTLSTIKKYTDATIPELESMKVGLSESKVNKRLQNIKADVQQLRDVLEPDIQIKAEHSPLKKRR